MPAVCREQHAEVVRGHQRASRSTRASAGCRLGPSPRVALIIGHGPVPVPGLRDTDRTRARSPGLRDTDETRAPPPSPGLCDTDRTRAPTRLPPRHPDDRTRRPSRNSTSPSSTPSSVSITLRDPPADLHPTHPIIRHAIHHAHRRAPSRNRSWSPDRARLRTSTRRAAPRLARSATCGRQVSQPETRRVSGHAYPASGEISRRGPVRCLGDARRVADPRRRIRKVGTRGELMRSFHRTSDIPAG